MCFYNMWGGGGQWKIDVILWSKAVYDYFGGRARPQSEIAWKREPCRVKP